MRDVRLEPEEAHDFAIRPEMVRDVADQRESGRSGPGLTLSNDLLHKPLVFVRLAVIQRWVLHDLSTREPDKGLWPKKTS